MKTYPINKEDNPVPSPEKAAKLAVLMHKSQMDGDFRKLSTGIYQWLVTRFSIDGYLAPNNLSDRARLEFIFRPDGEFCTTVLDLVIPYNRTQTLVSGSLLDDELTVVILETISKYGLEALELQIDFETIRLYGVSHRMKIPCTLPMSRNTIPAMTK